MRQPDIKGHDVSRWLPPALENGDSVPNVPNVPLSAMAWLVRFHSSSALNQTGMPAATAARFPWSTSTRSSAA